MRKMLALLATLFLASAKDALAQPQGSIVVSPSSMRVAIFTGKGVNDNWLWNNVSTTTNELEYMWAVEIPGDTAYSLGYRLYKYPGLTPRTGSLDELLRSGQSSVFMTVGDKGHLVSGVRPMLRAEGSSIVVELRDKEQIVKYFARRPEYLTLQVLTPTQPLASRQVKVKYEGGFAR